MTKLVTETVHEDIERVPCPLCGADDTAACIRGRGPMQIVRCQRDGMVFVNPRRTRSRIKALCDAFVPEDTEETFAMHRDVTLGREAKAIMSVKNGGNLLDVGCATGRFFAAFPPSWRLFGVDPCPQAVAYARRHYRAEVRCGSPEEACWPERFFDVVTILDALYYFPDPVRELTEVGRILKPDGILALEIPGFTYKMWRERGPVCWLLDRKWSRLTPESMHLYHFSPRTLTLLLAKAGFDVVKRLPQQAPVGRSIVADAVNYAHFGAALAISGITGGHVSIAAKEFYLCRKR